MTRIIILFLFVSLFTNGFSQITDWHAQRITANENQNESNTWLDFKKKLI